MWRLLVHRPGAESRTSRGLPRKENLLHLDVLGSASGGHGQAEVRDDTTYPGRDPVGPQEQSRRTKSAMAVCNHFTFDSTIRTSRSCTHRTQLPRDGVRRWDADRARRRHAPASRSRHAGRRGSHPAQAAGLLHRDLKPDNILVSGPASAPPYRVNILDFRLAKSATASELDVTRMTRHTDPGTIAGWALCPNPVARPPFTSGVPSGFQHPDYGGRSR